MLIADTNKCKKYLLEKLWKDKARYIWKLIKKYVDFFRDYEKKIKKYSDKKHKEVEEQLHNQENILKEWFDKDVIIELLKYKAQVEIYLKLKK